MRRGSTTSRRTVREVRHPQQVWALGSELAIDQVRRPHCRLFRDRRLEPLAARRASQSEVSHKALHGAARHPRAFASELLPNLANAIRTEVLMPHTLNLLAQFNIALRPRRLAARIGVPPLVLVVR